MIKSLLLGVAKPFKKEEEKEPNAEEFLTPIYNDRNDRSDVKFDSVESKDNSSAPTQKFSQMVKRKEV